MFGAVVCSIAPSHLFPKAVHARTDTSCGIEVLLISTVIVSREQLVLFGLLVLLAVFLVLAKSFLEIIRDKLSLPGWFLKMNNLAIPRHDYLLIAFARGILHAHVY